jgi:hypothetical protein
MAQRHRPGVAQFPVAVRSLSTMSVSLVGFESMNRSYIEIAEQALTLSQSEQLRLARTLLENAEAAGDVGAEAACEEEIERRIHKIDTGLAKGRAFADVLRDIDRRFGR